MAMYGRITLIPRVPQCFPRGVQAPCKPHAEQENKPRSSHGEVSRRPSTDNPQIVDQLLVRSPISCSCRKADATEGPQQHLLDLTPELPRHRAVTHLMAQHCEQQQRLVTRHLSDAKPKRHTMPAQSIEELIDEHDNQVPTDPQRSARELSCFEGAVIRLLRSCRPQAAHCHVTRCSCPCTELQKLWAHATFEISRESRLEHTL
mmetsp:Transcript_65027/g.172160  ORF Transcript_65027/g.172160 Transcript_65027/m.172160 type:complete len:204 (-) Transcript_65027:20-631(-)